MLQSIWRFFTKLLQMFGFHIDANSNSPSGLKIFVRCHGGVVVPLNLDPKWTIGDVKSALSAKTGIQPRDLRIIFAGKELLDVVKIEECDLGQQSVIHAVKTVVTAGKNDNIPGQSVKSGEEDTDKQWPVTSENMKSHFYVYCTPCKKVCQGKLRVRCSKCKLGTLTVTMEPCNWDDVLIAGRVSGICQGDDCDGNIAEFYFKCGQHPSTPEDNYCVALYLIRPNLQEIPCLACLEISDPILVFPCTEGHTLCLECFREYCVSRLKERRFTEDKEIGYTISCPEGCEDSFIKESHHFRLLGEDEYARYQKFATEEFVLQNGGILCPQPGCGAGIIPDEDCQRVVCVQQGGSGCGFVFCRKCLQGSHLGECLDSATAQKCDGSEDRWQTERVRWDEASKITIKVSTKPCPKCRTPTERDGGCMHMVCIRSQCGFHWCWVCQTEWTRDCMGNHWFG